MAIGQHFLGEYPISGSNAGTLAAPSAPEVSAYAPVLRSVGPERRVCRAAYILALAFVPLVASAATATAPAAQGGDLARAGRTRQYQSVTGPVVVPAAGETVTLDKWKGTAPDRIRGKARSVPSGGVAPLFVPDVTQPVAPLSWRPALPDPRRRVSRPSSQAVAPVAVPDPTGAPTLSWQRQAPEPARRLAPRPATALAAPVTVPAPAVAPALSWHVPNVLGRMPKDGPAIQYAPVTGPLESWVPTDWRPRYPDRFPAPVGRFSGSVGVIEPIVPPPPETATAPAHQGGDIARGATRRQYAALVGPVLVPAAAAPAPWVAAPGPVRRRLRSPAEGTRVVAPPAVAPVVPPLSWLATTTNLGRMAKDGPAIQYAPVTGPVEVVVPHDWLGALPPVRRARRGTPLPVQVQPVLVPAAPSTVLLDWWQTPSRPLSRRVRQQPPIPGVFFIAPPAAPSLSGWQGSPSVPVRRPRWTPPVWGGDTLYRTPPPEDFGPCEMWVFAPLQATFPMGEPLPCVWVAPPGTTVYTFDQPASTFWVYLPGMLDPWEW